MTISVNCSDCESNQDDNANVLNVANGHKRKTLVKCVRKDAHIKCALLTIMVASCMATIFWCHVSTMTRIVVNFGHRPMTIRQTVSPCDNGYYYLPLVLWVSLYLLYIIECWRSASKFPFECPLGIQDIGLELDKLRAALPVIWWKSVSYHYVQRTRQVTRIRSGIATAMTQVYYERINLPPVCGSFQYGACGVKDISKSLTNLSAFAAYRIKVTKGFAFANLQAATEFEDQRAHFFRGQDAVDDNIDMREGLDLIGCVSFSQLNFNVTRSSRSWLVSPAFYWTLSLLLLSWPARFIMEANICDLDYKVTKLFGCNYVRNGPLSHRSLGPGGGHQGALLANCSLPPSYSQVLRADDRDKVARTKCCVPPSYSEAALMVKGHPAAGQEDQPMRESISTTILSDGQIGYLVSSLPEISNQDNYDHGQCAAYVTSQSGSRLLNLLRLKRSFTDKDFHRIAIKSSLSFNQDKPVQL
ncbi:putative transmembrane protein [Halotydeus destructor]|nr:putative transmembrane protein [Halotydeus destructor]